MIRSEIGSHFAGTPSDTIDDLMVRLAAEPLDASFAPFVQAGPLLAWHTGDLMYPDAPEVIRVRGNFKRISCAFLVDTDEPDLIARLRAAILENMRRPDYRRQMNGGTW